MARGEESGPLPYRRTCESCRTRKLACDRDALHPHAQCDRCRKLGIPCEVTKRLPVGRPKKAETDARWAAAEEDSVPVELALAPLSRRTRCAVAAAVAVAVDRPVEKPVAHEPNDVHVPPKATTDKADESHMETVQRLKRRPSSPKKIKSLSAKARARGKANKAAAAAVAAAVAAGRKRKGEWRRYDKSRAAGMGEEPTTGFHLSFVLPDPTAMAAAGRSPSPKEINRTPKPTKTEEMDKAQHFDHVQLFNSMGVFVARPHMSPLVKPEWSVDSDVDICDSPMNGVSEQESGEEGEGEEIDQIYGRYHGYARGRIAPEPPPLFRISCLAASSCDWNFERDTTAF